LVGGHGEAGVGVAEAFGDDLDGDAGGETGGVGVAQVVESDRGYVESGNLAGEELADCLGVQRPAVGVGEDRVLERDRMTVRCLLVAPCV